MQTLASPRVAIVSPDEKTYSETFIHAHKSIRAKIYYYYGGFIPRFLEGEGFVGARLDILSRLKYFLVERFSSYHLTGREQEFLTSLRKNKIDVVIAEYGTTAATIVRVCKVARLPLIAMFHGYDASITKVLNEYLERYRELFRYSSTIMAVSGFMKRKLIDLGCPEDKIRYNCYGPNETFFSVEPTFKERKTFVAIGRFVNKKAPYYTILAIDRVRQRHPDVKLYFAGDGELLESCRNLTKGLKLDQNVFLLGKVKPEEFRSLLSNALAFVQHSITAENGDMEGTPVAVLEASAAGLPVIATRHAGIPEVIVDGETGLLIDEHDVEGMAEKMIAVIETPGLAEKLGNSGKLNVQENFAMAKHLNEIETAIDNCLRLI